MKKIKRFQDLINKSERIIITTHLLPDPDGIGSQIALCLALRSLGKDALCVNQRPLLTRYRYLDLQSTVLSYKEYQHKYKNKGNDLFIIVDTNRLTQIGKDVATLARKSSEVLFIDHHPCAEESAIDHCINTQMSATGELVGSLIEALGVQINKEIALALYTAIVIDSSSFRYPTVTGNTHRLIARLLDTGITPTLAYNKIYGTKKVSHIELLGVVLSSARVNNDGRIGWLTLSEKTLKKFNADPEDTHAFINQLLVLNNIQIVCMFRQIGSSVKISFRSHGTIDVGNIAKALGGGGHNHSAATIQYGQLNRIVKKTIKKLEELLDIYY